MPKLAWIPIILCLAGAFTLTRYQQSDDTPTRTLSPASIKQTQFNPLPLPPPLEPPPAQPPETQVPDAQRLLALLTVEDPAAAVEIIQREQLGTVADEAITTLVHQNLSAEDYATAIEWAAQITNPDLRADALRQTYAQAYRAGLLLDAEVDNSQLPPNVIAEIKALSYLD